MDGGVVERLLERADSIEPFSPPAAAAFREAAAEVEAWLRKQHIEPLTLDVAARESGYSVRHLRRLIREDKLTNVGTDEDPRVLRGHLPRKPGWGLAKTRPRVATSAAQAARAIATLGGRR